MSSSINYDQQVSKTATESKANSTSVFSDTLPSNIASTNSGNPHSSMIYVETIKERQIRLGCGNSISDKMKDVMEDAYWVYYVHLPFYLMTSFDAFCLHSFFLTIFSLSIFGVIKYCFLLM